MHRGPVSLPAFLARRLLVLLVTLLVVVASTFAFLSVATGRVQDAGTLASDLGQYLSATVQAPVLDADGTDHPVFEATENAVDGMATGLGADLAVLAGGLLAGVVGGYAGGAILATRPRTLRARAVDLANVVAISTPTYWLGVMVLLVFSPGFGHGPALPFLSGIGAYRPPLEAPLAFLEALWVPWLLVGLPIAAAVARLSGALLRDALGEQHIVAARGRGASGRRLMLRHAGPLTAPAVATLVAAQMNLIIVNVAVIEAVFNVPGSLRFISRAMTAGDIAAIQALVLEGALLIVVANFAADAVHARLDPRVR